jgi:hypothetical protein
MKRWEGFMSSDVIDPVCVPDVFATEMVSVEDLGGVFRFTFATRQNGEVVVVARICLLASAVPEARRLTASAVAQSSLPVFRALRVSH